MGIFFGAFLTGLGLLFMAVIFQIRRERSRAFEFRGLELEPNCLLTRHPLVFLAGGRSVFKIFDHWNQIPRYLREHGYEVLILEPPAGLGIDVQTSLIRALDDLPEAGHLIADSSLEAPLESISRAKHAKVASLTLVRNASARAREAKNRRVDAAALRPPAYAIETFEIPAPKKTAHGPQALTARLLFFLHNLASQARGQDALDPVETGDLMTKTPWEIERSFLRLAVTLAERDLQETRPEPRPEAPAQNTSATLGA